MSEPKSDESFNDDVLELLQGATGDGMVTGFVVLVEYVDGDGDVSWWGSTLRGQPAHRSLGLLAYATEIERLSVARSESRRHGGTND